MSQDVVAWLRVEVRPDGFRLAPELRWEKDGVTDGLPHALAALGWKLLYEPLVRPGVEP